MFFSKIFSLKFFWLNEPIVCSLCYRLKKDQPREKKFSLYGMGSRSKITADSFSLKEKESQIVVTEYKQPAIYAIDNTETEERYVGETENLLNRMADELTIIRANQTHCLPKKLIRDYNTTPEKIKFSILEQGSHLTNKSDIITWECRYVNQHLDKKKPIYNNMSFKYQSQLNNVKCEKNPPSLNPINQNVTYLTCPGVYFIKNKKTERIYIGEAESIVKRFFTHSSKLNVPKKHPNKKLNTDWQKYGKTNFEFGIFEYGTKFEKKKYALRL